ncbi:hypothetical protein [Nocardioides immobilis]|uniref:hypothetical protein n=1 Tax=Nocardioides immobilis TaxID=2049295 RepID=UPI0011C48DA0|nr:hypothetical protein [Nocardioides immobilis]
MTYTTSVFGDSRRDSSKGWLALGAGAALLVWLVLFLALSATTVWASLTAGGPMEPVLVLLVAAWIVCAGLVVVVFWKTPVALRYLVESYRPEETPCALRWIRRRLFE